MDMRNLNPWNWFAHENTTEEWLDSAKSQYHQSLEYLQKELDTLKEVTEKTGNIMPNFWPAVDKSLMLRPRVDISESPQHYTIAVEVPGVREEDVALEVDNYTLRITGEKKMEYEEEEGKEFHLIERSYGQFQRVLSLPTDSEMDKVEAYCKDGVILVTLPRKEAVQSKPKKITLKKAA